MNLRLRRHHRTSYDAIFRRHGEVAERIVGSTALDERRLTVDQLLAKARDFYAKIASHENTPSITARTGSNR